VQCVQRELLTPFGLRSLAPTDKNFKSKYHGSLHDRDAAYHQGTVWPWLIGPFIDAWLKVHPHDFLTAEHFLESFRMHLGESAVGSIAEIFDAEAPYIPRGCFAQAWSVSEVLRSFAKVGALKAVGESAQVA
jgi:glycogen debranching enzyme